MIRPNRLRAFLWAVLPALLSLYAPTVRATHLIGGNLGYVGLGETAPGSGLYAYQVYMEFYLNCGAGSSFETFYDLLQQDYNTPLVVGCYIEDPLDPLADKIKLQDIPLILQDSLVIEPDLPNNCTVGQGLCTVKGTFSGQVIVPLNFGGYHLYYQMCCRNLSITNLQNPNGTGIGYYAFIPPPLVQNSSPVFIGPPTPFLCTSDTTTFVNTAVDPDGDLLVFSFETPYNSTIVGGGIIPPPGQLPWPVPTVGYQGGFSAAQPFGGTGYSFVNGATGLTRYFSPNQGNYVVAVEVKEFRNGQLIGRIRRDLQLQVVVCPPNATPSLTSIVQQTYSVSAGDTLCLDLDFLDADGDSLTLTAAGAIFDPNLVDPPAVINAPVEGLGVVGAQFCWATACDQGQDQPYLFSVSVTDNGCPPKTLDIVLAIEVEPFLGPQNIAGPPTVCAGTAGVNYSTDTIAGATYTWNVVGGNLVGGNGTPGIVVDWTNPGSASISVAVTDQLGCTAEPLELSVTVAPEPLADAGADTLICSGTSVQLGGSPTGPPGSTFQWNPANGLSNANSATPTATPQAATTYVVLVNSGGCTATDTIVVGVQETSAEAGDDDAICMGDTIPLNGSGGNTYQWSPASELSDAGIAGPLAFPSSTTTFILQVTDSVGCTALDSVLIEVLALPTVDAGPDTTACAGSVIQLGGAPTGPPGAGYSWSPITGIDDPNSANPFATLSTSQNWVVQVTDSSGCASMDSVTVTVLQAPPLDAGADTLICPGDSVQLQATGTGTFIWSPASGLSDPSIAAPLASPSQTTLYTVQLDDGNGCPALDSLLVTVAPPVQAEAGSDVAICQGDTIALQASGGGTYEWNPAIFVSDPSAPDPLAFPQDTTTFIVTVTSAFGCVGSDSVRIEVTPPPFAGLDGSLTLCGDDQAVDLNGLLGGGQDPGGSWTDPDGAAHGNVFDPQVDPGGAYIHVVPGAGACPDDTATVLVNVLAPSVDAGPDLTLCQGDTVQLSGSGAGALIWSPALGLSDPNVPDPLAFASVPTTYLLQATDTNGCTAADSMLLTVVVPPLADAGEDQTVCAGTSALLGGSPTGPPGSAFQWSPASDLDDPASGTPTATPPTTTWYSVLVTDADGCFTQDSVLVSVLQAPALDAGPDTAVCAGGSVQLGAVGTGTFLWDPATGLDDPASATPLATPVNTTTYLVTLTDTAGCSNTDQVTVTVLELPVAMAGEDLWVCPGSGVALSASGGTSYSWSPATSLDDPFSATPLATPAVTTTYVVTVTDAAGCADQASQTVTVSDDPPVDAGPDQTICAGESVFIGGSPSGLPGSSFSWSPAIGLDDPSLANPLASPSADQLYTLTVSNDTCTSSDQMLVLLSGNAEAGFSVRLEPGCDGLRAFFTDLSTGAVSYLWDFGDGTTSTLPSPQHVLPYGTPVTVVLQVTDANGCTGTATQLLAPGTYDDLVGYTVPNVFTPNGDGYNDVFTLDTDAFLGPCTDLFIYNRWGQKIFESLGNNITWDGTTFAGEPCVPGTYFYLFNVNGMTFEGSVLLNR